MTNAAALASEVREALKGLSASKLRAVLTYIRFLKTTDTVAMFLKKLYRPNWSRVNRTRELMHRRYGVLPDSTPLIRAMRDGY